MRAVEIFQAFPGLLFAMLVVQAVGAGIMNVILVLSFVGIPDYLRLARAEIHAKQDWQYAEAARMAGNLPWRVAFRHLLPNSVGPLLAFTSINAAFSALVTASLGFLGLGLGPNVPEWGNMIARGQDGVMTGQWWVSFFPGLAILGLTGGLLSAGRRTGRPHRSAAAWAMSDILLEIEDYSGGFRSKTGDLMPVLHGVSYRLKTGVMTAVVGEIGSGKSLVALSILGIQPPAFERTAAACCSAAPISSASTRRRCGAIRGAQISMVFQDARAALNPVFTVGRQLADVWQLQHGGGRRAAMKQAIEALGGSLFPSRSGGHGSIRTNSPAAWRSAR